MARQMVMRYGMSDKLGPMTLGEAQHEVFLGRDYGASADYSQEIAYEIDKEVRRLVDDAFTTARTILEERRSQLDLMSEVLIERETVDKDELKALLDDRWDEYVEQEEAEEQEADEAEDAASEAEEPEEEPALGKTEEKRPPAGEGSLGIHPSG
jgi:cell division protease FtsH